MLAFLYTPDLFLEADFSACFAVLSTSSILSGNRFLVICWSVKLKVMTTLSLYKITSRIKFLIVTPFEIKDVKGKTIKGNTYSVRSYDEDGTVYECPIKPARTSDKSFLNMLLR